MLKKLLGAAMTLAPHSMQVERIISHHNLLDDDMRSGFSSETLNYRLFVSLNGSGTCSYDPRPAVAHFLQQKERRNREPTLSLYKELPYMKKFFRTDGCL